MGEYCDEILNTCSVLIGRYTMFKKVNRIYGYLIVIGVTIIIGVMLSITGGFPVLSETLSIPYFSTASPDHTFPPSGDIWDVEPPPNWTPPSLPGADHTPRPAQFTSVPPRSDPTPTLLPDVGISLTAPAELDIQAMVKNSSSNSNVRLQASALAGTSLIVTSEFDAHSVIALLDTSSNEIRVLTTTTFNDDQSAAKLWVENANVAGDYAIWTVSQYKGRQGVLYLYHIPTQKTIEVAENVYQADMSESMLVWQQSDGYQWDIWGYDLIQGEIFQIVNRAADQGQAIVSGRWVVYQDAVVTENDQVALYAINVDTQEDIYLTMVDSFSDQYTLPTYTIDAPWLIWSTESTLNFYNLETHAQHAASVAACPSSESKPVYLEVSGDIVIFSCGQKLGYDIVSGDFFSLPLQYTSDLLETSWVDGVFSEGRLVWVLSDSPWDTQTDQRIFSAQIQRKP